jgi:hypothetical protein
MLSSLSAFALAGFGEINLLNTRSRLLWLSRCSD